MRLWSIHPKYLDRKGLLAVWREGLLAKKVLEGKTKGYTRHPQLERFRGKPGLIERYLLEVWKEAERRGYKFDSGKIGRPGKSLGSVTEGQLGWEFAWLKKKLRERDPGKLKELAEVMRVEANPVFRVGKGAVESWEKWK